MILTAHLLTGAVIASKISNPILALPLALLSHYFLDLCPRGEYSIPNIKEKRWGKSFFDFTKVSLDVASGLGLILLFSENTPLIFMASFLATVPDGFHFLFIIFPKNRLLVYHHRFHAAINMVFCRDLKITPFGVFGQALVILIAILLL